MASQRTYIVSATAALSVLSFGGCGGFSTAPLSPATRADEIVAAASRQTPIKHVILIIQENRSFDNFFAGYPGADSTMVGKTHDGKSVRLQAITFSRVPLNHFYQDARTDLNGGKMNGFDLVKPNPPFSNHIPYSYVERSLVKPYWDMARQYVLVDHMFPTELGPSFTSHLNLIAGTTTVAKGKSVVDMATLNGNVQNGSCDDPKGTVTSLLASNGDYLRDQGPFPCFEFRTLADVLDPAGISWKYYGSYWPSGASLWNEFNAIKAIRYGPDWQNVVKKNKVILTDAAAGNLPAVSWVVPTMPDSDHPGAGKPYGPSWVSAVVNAIGTGPDWKSSAIIVVWDDWGGWYDNAPPPQLDYRGLGLRVPCIVISPYAKKGYIASAQYEFGSILKTIEQIYGLPEIGTTDRRATPMFDAFDFTQSPRPFKAFSAPFSKEFLLHEPPAAVDPGD